MHRNASLFVAISVLAGFGGGVMALVSGIWILDLTGSPGLAGLAGLCVYAPTLAGPGLGALAGRVVARHGVVFLSVAGALLYAAGLFAKCLPWTPAVVAGAVLNGALPWTLIAAVTAIQAQVPQRLLGRASATSSTVMFGPVALANPLGAALSTLGGRPGLAVSGAICLVTGLVVLRAATRRRYAGTPSGQPART